MGTINLSDISLRNFTIESLPRLKRLRERHFRTVPAICTELPRNITYFMQHFDNPADSPELRAGKLYHYVLDKKKAVIPDENLLAGTTTTKEKGVLLYPDFLALSIWPELETISRRAKNPFRITRNEIRELNENIFPYWLDRTVQETARRDYGNPLCQRIMERIVFFLASKPYTISHTIPDYRVVVERGLIELIREAREKELSCGNSGREGEKREFYQAVRLALQGIIAYALHLGEAAHALARREKDGRRRQELLDISEICLRVPAERPRNLREALNALWICKVALYQENANAALSLGRLDQVLYPFYEQERKNGLSLQGTLELLGCFWLKIADHVPVTPETSEELFGGAGSNQAITLGGVDMQGEDAVNDLTYLMLKVTELLKLRDPNVNARYYPDVNPRGYLERLCEVNISTKATPCFHNDISAIDTLENQGISLEHARDYSSVGCVEPSSGGRTFGHTGSLLVNLTSILEMALFGGKHRLTENEQIGPKTKPAVKMTSFEEFKKAFETQAAWLIDQAVSLNNNLGYTHQKIHPLPLLSAFMDGCMEKGIDVISGGALYNSSGVAIIGLADTVDSITALKELVFEKKLVSMGEMIGAINADWGGRSTKIRAMAGRAGKFGTDSTGAHETADWIIGFLHDTFQGRENYRGGKYTVGYWSMTNHAGFGALTGALPNGRGKGEPFASGITPVAGAAPQLTPCLNFVASLDHRHIANGHALNLKFPPSTATPVRLADYVEGFFRSGGLQVQCNVMDRHELEEARENPKKYPDLLVRVSGYTAYFKDLNRHMQDEIIRRAQYDMTTGREVE